MLGRVRSSVLSFVLLSFLPFDAWLPVQALRNITIDNSDGSAINYKKGDWTFGTYDSGATDHWADSPDASATVQFTGVAVYYLVHLYPNFLPAGGLLSVDDYPATSVVMWDPNNGDFGKNETTVWQMTGLANSTHTLHVNYWDNGNNSYISLDTILVTQLESNDPAPSQATTSTTVTSKKTLPIVLGTVFGLLFLGAVIAAAFFWNRLRRNRAGAASHEPSEVKPFMSSSAPQGVTQFNPFNPQPFAASGINTGMNTMDNTRTARYGYSLSDLRAPNQAVTMSSQTSLYVGQAPSSSHAVGGAMSARLPEV